MNIYAGFDCGGTSTRCALADENGSLLGIGKGGPSNYIFCGRETAAESLRNAVSEAFKAAGMEVQPIKRSFIASAAVEVGYGEEHIPFFKECIGGKLDCDSDIIPVKYAVACDRPAIAVIAGTGAVVYALYPDRFVKSSGWGPLLGDEGSGYDIGLNALRTAARISDGRLPYDGEFLSAVLDGCGVPADKPRRLLRALNTSDQRSTVAKSAITVRELYYKGNKTAAYIMNKAADELETAVKAVLERTGDENFPVVLSGGTLGRNQPLYTLLRNRLLKYPRITGVYLPGTEPVVTSTAIALQRDGNEAAAKKLLGTERAKGSTSVKAGYAKKDITPRKPGRLSGFDYRTEPSAGVLDNIYVSAAVTEDGNGIRSVFASFDLLGVSSYLCDEMMAAIYGKYNIEKENIHIFATHTHAAPMAVFRYLPAYDREYSDSVVRSFAEAVREAVSDLRPASVRTFETTVPGVASLRDRPRGESTYEMPSDNIVFEREDGGDILLCGFACHSTVFSEKNLLVSRDLPGGCEKALGNRYKTVYFNGACADLSCRYTKTAATDEERYRLGGIWADCIIKAAESGGRLCDFGTSSVCEKLFIPPASFFTEEERENCRKHLEHKIAVCTDESTKREYTSCLAVINRKSYGKAKGETVSISFSDFGDFGLLTLPFEVPSGEGKRYCEEASAISGKKVCIACYSGGYDGYLPSGRQVDFDSGYTDMDSVYTSEAKNMVMECIKKCVRATTAVRQRS